MDQYLVGYKIFKYILLFNWRKNKSCDVGSILGPIVPYMGCSYDALWLESDRTALILNAFSCFLTALSFFQNVSLPAHVDELFG